MYFVNVFIWFFALLYLSSTNFFQQLFQLEYLFIYLKDKIMLRKLVFDNRLSRKNQNWPLT